MNRLLYWFLFFIFSIQSSFAVEELVKNYRGIRSLSMGGILTTTGHYSEALFGNPALHSDVETWKFSILDVTAHSNYNFVQNYKELRTLFGSDGANVIGNIGPVISKPMHVRTDILTAFYDPKLIGDMGFAIGWLTSVKGNFWIRNTTDVDAQTFVDMGPNFGFSHPFLDDTLLVGINIHMLYRAGVDESIYVLDFLANRKKLRFKDFARQGIGLDSDIGVHYRIPFELPDVQLSVSAAVNNLVKSHYAELQNSFLWDLPSRPMNNDRVFSTGVRADFPDTWIFGSPVFAVEFQNLGSKQKQYTIAKMSHFGGEAHLTRHISVRGGVGQGYFAGGFGFDLPVLKIDLGTYGEELTGVAGEREDRRVMLRLAFEI